MEPTAQVRVSEDVEVFPGNRQYTAVLTTVVLSVNFTVNLHVNITSKVEFRNSKSGILSSS